MLPRLLFFDIYIGSLYIIAESDFSFFPPRSNLILATLLKCCVVWREGYRKIIIQIKKAMKKIQDIIAF